MNLRANKLLYYISLLLLNFGICHSTHGNEPSVCDSTRLASLTLERMDRSESPNFCKLSPSQVPAEISNIIQQADENHRKVASYFGITQEQLLPSRIKLILRAHNQGPFSSQAHPGSGPTPIEASLSASTITYGIYPDWAGEPLNDSIYIHELAHILGYLENQYLPPLWKKLDSTPLMHEAIPDIVAMAVTGTLYAPMPDLPNVFSESPALEFESFSSPVKEFTSSKFNKRIKWLLHGCTEAENSGLHTPHSKLLCQDLFSTPEKPVEDVLFSVDYYKQHQLESTLDSHSLGAPLLSFFNSLQKATQQDIYRLFFKTLWIASSAAPTQLKCSIPMLQELVPTQNYEVRSMALVFDEFRKQFSGENLKLYDLFWSQHGMDTAYAISKVDERLPGEAISNFVNLLLKEESRLQSTECWSETSSRYYIPFLNPDVFGCTIECIP